MSKPKVIVTRHWPREVEAQLQKLFDVTLNVEDKPMDQGTLQQAFRDYDAVFPTVTDQINDEVMSAEPLRARMIGNFGVGFNNIDISSSKARGLVVTNTPEVLTDATAESFNAIDVCSPLVNQPASFAVGAP